MYKHEKVSTSKSKLKKFFDNIKENDKTKDTIGELTITHSELEEAARQMLRRMEGVNS